MMIEKFRAATVALNTTPEALPALILEIVCPGLL
jgi:hypothetical protein